MEREIDRERKRERARKRKREIHTHACTYLYRNRSKHQRLTHTHLTDRETNAQSTSMPPGAPCPTDATHVLTKHGQATRLRIRNQSVHLFCRRLEAASVVCLVRSTQMLLVCNELSIVCALRFCKQYFGGLPRERQPETVPQ